VRNYYSNGGCTGYGYDLAVVESSSGAVPPAAPSNLSATAISQAQINLSWTDNSSNESGFKIERWDGSKWQQIGTVGANVTIYSDTGLTCNTTYYYQVRAYNASGDSANSNTASATTFACTAAPAAPSALTAAAASQTQINLSWTDNSNNESGFKIERWDDMNDWTEIDTVGSNITTYANTGLHCGMTYYYRVYAYNASGGSANSNTDNATTFACVGQEDVYEPDDSYENAKSITVDGVTRTHNFFDDGVDWTQFTAAAGKTYTIETSNLDVNSNTVLQLYGTDGKTLLDSNDDCPGGGVESCINDWAASGNGAYYVKVSNKSGASANSGYDLAIDESSNVYLPLILRNY
jgi:hypothetical protein